MVSSGIKRGFLVLVNNVPVFGVSLLAVFIVVDEGEQVQADEAGLFSQVGRYFLGLEPCVGRRDLAAVVDRTDGRA